MTGKVTRNRKAWDPAPSGAVARARSRWPSLVVRVALLAAVIGVVAACSGGAAVSPAGSSKASSTTTHRVAMPAGEPGCSAATGQAPVLPRVQTSMQSVPGSPFGVVTTPGGGWSLVSLADGSVGLFRGAGTGPPRLVRQISVGAEALGEALTAGGRYLLVADGGSGAYVVSVAAAQRGQPQDIGTLSANGPAAGAIEVAVSPDNRFAFVSLEGSDQIAVFNLQRALASRFATSGFVGFIPTGVAPVGMAVSPNGRWLYVTSELASSQAQVGTLAVISMRRAETKPATAVLSTVAAGCNPVRVITSADGSVVWVTARASDELVGFDAARLLSQPARALIAKVRVGELPVGLALVDGGGRIVVADSNRFNVSGASSSLALVDADAALRGKPALIGYIKAGAFPRQMAAEPGGRVLLVTNFDSRQLETVSLAGLP